jgi:23S rRNA pseudouridine2605 synthase/23S rRNA pseudouridine2604 synthase
VTVDGVVAGPGTKVSPSGGKIVVDGILLGEKSDKIYKFHKTFGVLSSYSDPNGKRNLSSFPELAKMKMGYSGRLDFDSEGLMLFTANGELIYKIQRKEFAVEKEYHVNTDKDITEEWIERLCNGIELDGEQLLPCQVYRVDRCRYTVILTEGKKRQVRRMLYAAGATVTRLIRVRIGTIKLDKLNEGQLKLLTDKEIEELMRCIE